MGSRSRQNIYDMRWQLIAEQPLVHPDAMLQSGPLVEGIERHPDSQVWNRSMESLRTAHIDLNWPQPWFVRVGYAILGRVAWPFIK